MASFRTDTESLASLITQMRPDDPPGHWTLWRLDRDKPLFDKQIQTISDLKYAKKLALVPNGKRERDWKPVQVEFISRSRDPIIFPRIWWFSENITRRDCFKMVDQRLKCSFKRMMSFRLCDHNGREFQADEHSIHWRNGIGWERRLTVVLMNLDELQGIVELKKVCVPRAPSKRRLNLTDCLKLFTKKEKVPTAWPLV
eukprot:TRINITY_DN2942_c0_g1_i1.p1 TRINITY_DN2942_c0_g1~~TRINITY_DN2942_c0_g1_i1.p1  ORF type:complete len:199 (-),score=29.60 TRINITY_DN2942_c0_g1_i1:27-623(-)